MRTSACVFTVWAKARGGEPRIGAAAEEAGCATRKESVRRQGRLRVSVGYGSAERRERHPRRVRSIAVQTCRHSRAGPSGSRCAAALLPQLPPMAAISQLCASRGPTAAARHASDRMASSARTAEVKRRPAGGRERSFGRADERSLGPARSARAQLPAARHWSDRPDGAPYPTNPSPLCYSTQSTRADVSGHPLHGYCHQVPPSCGSTPPSRGGWRCTNACDACGPSCSGGCVAHRGGGARQTGWTTE